MLILSEALLGLAWLLLQVQFLEPGNREGYTYGLVIYSVIITFSDVYITLRLGYDPVKDHGL